MKKKLPKRIWITFAVEAETKKAVEAAAKQDGRTVSQFLRMNIEKMLAK